MAKQYCKDCVHFLQHYALSGGKLYRVYCGHCTLQRAKRRRPDADACDAFVYAAPDEDAFVTREYLSKELLRYVCSLELLPPIETLSPD